MIASHGRSVSSGPEDGRGAQIRRDNAVFVLELVERVERVARSRQPRDRRVQPAAGNDQQRKTGASFFVMDADGAFFVEWHDGFSLRGEMSSKA